MLVSPWKRPRVGGEDPPREQTQSGSSGSGTANPWGEATIYEKEIYAVRYDDYGKHEYGKHELLSVTYDFEQEKWLFKWKFTPLPFAERASSESE